MRKHQPSVLRAVVINGGQTAAVQGEFRITADELELLQIYRQVPFDDRMAAKGFLEITLRDTLQERKSKKPALSLVCGGEQ